MPDNSAVRKQLEQIITQYDEKQRISRLMTIGFMKNPQFPNAAAVTHEAVLFAHELLEKSPNVNQFKDVTNYLFERGVNVKMDPEKVTLRERGVSQELEGLQVRLTQATNAQKRDEALALALQIIELQASRGDMTGAMKMVARAKDMCSTPQDHAQLSLTVIQVSIFCSHTPLYATVAQYTSRVEQLFDALPDTELIALRIAQALTMLDRKQYAQAYVALTSVRRTPVNQGKKGTGNQNSTKIPKIN